MKRYGLPFVVGVAVMLALSLGLSIPDASAQAKLGITIQGLFTPGTNDLFKQQVQDWAKTKGVTAEVEFLTIDNLLPKAAVAAETGIGPDIASFPHSGPNLLAEKLVDMDDIANELGSKLGGWLDVAKRVSVVGGHWKAVPYYAYINALVYRRDLIQEIANDKVPDIWEDVVRIGKKLRPMGHPVGFALGHATGDASDFVYSLLWAYGAKEVEKDEKTIAINSPETKKGLEFIARLYKEAMPPGVLGWDDSSNNRMFLAGVLSVTNNSASIYWATRRDAPALRANTGHAIYPKGPAGRAHHTGVYGFGVFKYSKNLELAKDLIRYLMAPEQYAKWLESGEGNMTPLLSTYAGLPIWTKDPNLTAFAEALKYARAIGWPGGVTRAAAEVNAKFILVDMAARVAKGMPAQKSIDQAVSEMKEIYARH